MTYLIDDDGKAIACWEPRPGVWFQANHWTAEQAMSVVAGWGELRCWTLADVANWRATRDQ